MDDDERVTEGMIRKPDGNLRMDAYYYGFDLTGCEPIDKILAAVALAGKLMHHTECWGDNLYFDDPGPVEIIQHFANEAAELMKPSRCKADYHGVSCIRSDGHAGPHVAATDWAEWEDK